MNVTFCGHSSVIDREKVRKWLMKIVGNLSAEGADTFLLGGYGDFDKIAADIVWELKGQYPDIKSLLVIPYMEQKFELSKYDGTIYPDLENVPKKYAIVHRNRYMVNEADVIIAYVLHNWGGTAKTLEYAQKKNKRIILYNKHTE